MKKIKYLFAFMVIFLLCGCGIKSAGSDIIDKFEKKVNGVKSYSIVGTMEITSNEETYTYDVNVDYKYEDQYKVTLTNKVNNHEQVILKNTDGVYVVTPALNKSFKFQSEWPANSSQSYLLASLIKDIKNTKEPVIDKNDEYIIVNANVNYPNNSNLTSEKIYFDKKNNLKEVQVLNKDGNVSIRMKFNTIKYSAKFDDDNFNLDSLISTNECKGEEDCSSKEETEENKISSDEQQKDTTEEKTEETTSILDSIVYPLYLPTDTHLSTKDTIDTDSLVKILDNS